MVLSLAIGTGLLASYWIYLSLRPLAEEGQVSAADWARLDDDSTELLAKRDRLIEELKDIEFEAALNKVDGHDLELLRKRYESAAVDVMGELEDEVNQYGSRIEADINQAGQRRNLAAVTAQKEDDSAREEA